MTDAPTIETIWVTDAELIRRSGVPEKLMRRTIQGLDADPLRSGFPQKQKLFGGRRHWPSVKEYFAKRNGVRIAHQPTEGRRYG